MNLFSHGLRWLFLGVVFILSAPFAEAASLYIDPAFTTLHRGDTVTLSVRLNVDDDTGECVNAVDAVLSYGGGIDPVDVSIGDSIFTMWVEKPTIHPETQTITFAGGIPNGYCGRVLGDPRLTNTLAKIVVRSPGFTVGGTTDEVPAIRFQPETTAYLNDGRGSVAALATYDAEITLEATPGATMRNDWKAEVAADVLPPEKFSIALQKDDQAFSQKYYIVFNAVDKQTGIDHYEVMEEPIDTLGSFQWGRADAPWIVVPQPPVYQLKDQSLNSIIRVKAVDKAGNETISSLIPDEAMRSVSSDQKMLLVLVFVAGVLLLAVVILVVRYIRRRKQMTTIAEHTDSVTGAETVEQMSITKPADESAESTSYDT